MVAILFTAETVPQFEKIVDLIGGSTMTLMVFVMPPAFYIKLCSQKNPNWPQRFELNFRLFCIELYFCFRAEIYRNWPKYFSYK
jgi:hypothetical protein